MDGPPLEVKVWAEMACFTRPENKVERVSYPVMTPSAARGVFEAIFWKPEFDWRVREIVVLKPIRWTGILRNEVSAKASASSDGISITDARQQRHTLALYDVAYIIRADIVLRPHNTDDAAKYQDQFRRRVLRGQCFHRPYLGCREFAAEFAPPDGTENPIDDTRELGLMLQDVRFQPSATQKSITFYTHGGKKGDERERYLSNGTATPRFFSARLENGVLRVPEETEAMP